MASPERVKNAGLIGPVARAANVNIDGRRDHPYAAYDRVDFEVPVGSQGDNFDRYLVRLQECHQSIRIIDQCLRDIPAGPINVDDSRVVLPEKASVYNSIEGMINHFKLVFEGIQVPAGETYSATEAGNGELGFYIVYNGTGQPWRMRVGAPCFCLVGGMDRLDRRHPHPPVARRAYAQARQRQPALLWRRARHPAR